jgi:hypothetical protein
MDTTPEEHDRDRAATITPRAKRFAVGAGAAGALIGTLALLGAFQPNATAQTGTTDTSVSDDSDSTDSDSSDRGRHGHRRLTDEQRDCLAEQGVTKPAERPDGPPTQEQIDALKAAAEACGIELPAGGPGFGGCNRDGNDDSDDSDDTSDASSADEAIAA